MADVEAAGSRDIDTARELLRDSFTRLIEHVDDLAEDLTDDVAYYRPAPQANTIAWLIWHSARMQDAQVCDLAGAEQVWFREGWVDRFALDLPRDAHGYGHTPEEVAKVRAPAKLLAGYYHAVHKVSLEYVASLSADELARVIDRHWTPPVTAGARLVSIIDDAAQHLGQAAYIRGIVR
ncbi:mycothiol transferase [Mycobacterium sp. smrl_JER01]|uniref:mycothiol transferase n=1 Tax=Mycobacterium sp. smrl_JER01 TaxID=3402633 RepID=UPI003AC53D41